MPVGGVADLSGSQPLFASRNSTKLEQFLYVPNSVVVSPATFRNVIVPAFQRASAARGPGLKSPPVEEVDVLVDALARVREERAPQLVTVVGAPGMVIGVADCGVEAVPLPIAMASI